MEELQLHIAVLRKIERSVLHGAVKRKRFTVEVLVYAVKIRRTENVGVRHVRLQIPLRFEFVHAVIAPNGIIAAGLFLGKGLRIRFGIDSARTDENVIIKANACIKQRFDMLFRVSGDVEDQVKALAAEPVAQSCPVAADMRNAVHLRSAAAVDDRHIVAL